MSVLRLVIDRQAKSLVAYLGGVVALPSMFQSNVITLNVYVVDPTGDVSRPYSLVDLNGTGLRAAVGATPTGSSGGPTPLALQDTFTWNSDGKYFTADLALNTAGVDAHIGTAASAAAYFELNLTYAGNRDTILQTSVTLKAVVDELASTVPTPTDVYLTKAECLAMFAKLVGLVGERQLFKSANGLYGREIGVDNDGSGIDNLITL